ncbi:retrovirus-related pol polyprotein from transposon TNT 1-94 [Tanacetum coccineum]
METEHIICQDAMNVVMHADVYSHNVLPTNNNSLQRDNLASELLKHETDRLMKLLISQDLVDLAKKHDMIEKAVYNEFSKRCSRLENRCISLEIKLQQSKESFQTNRPSHNQDAPEFKDFFIINDLQAQLQAKNVSLEKLKQHITNLKGKNVVDSVQNTHNSNVVTSKVYKFDLQPLCPLIKNNRDAHVDYLKHTQENVDILCEIVKHARELRPLDSDLSSTYMFVTRIQELLVYVSTTCHSSKHVSGILLAVTPINRTRKVRFTESRVSSSTEASGSKPRSNTKKDRITQTLSSNKKKNKVEDHPRIAKYSLNNMNHVSKPVCNANVKHSVLNANSKLICATCNECMFDAIHDLCVRAYFKYVNARVKSKSVKSRLAKSKKNKMWKATGKVYTNVRYSWNPTERIFTIDGNTCPLTRIISTKVVPPRKSISTTIVKQKQPSSNKNGKLKDLTNVGPSSKSKTNLDGADLLFGSRDTNLYTISLDDMLKSSPICLLFKDSMTKSWPMGVESINRKKYVLVIVDDYSRFMWVKFLRSKDETPEVIIKFLKQIQVRLNVTVRNVQTDNGTKFVNQTLKDYYENVTFDELTAMASKQFSLGPAPQLLTPGTLSSGLMPNSPSSTPYVLPTKNDWDILFQPMFDEFFNPPPSVVSLVPVATAQRPADPTGSPVLTSIEQDAPSASTSSNQEQEQSPVLSKDVEE